MDFTDLIPIQNQSRNTDAQQIHCFMRYQPTDVNDVCKMGGPMSSKCGLVYCRY